MTKRRLRRQMCGNKTAYDDAQAALVAKNSAERRLGGYWRYYKCHVCRKYHIGHRLGWKLYQSGVVEEV